MCMYIYIYIYIYMYIHMILLIIIMMMMMMMILMTLLIVIVIIIIIIVIMFIHTVREGLSDGGVIEATCIQISLCASLGMYWLVFRLAFTRTKCTSGVTRSSGQSAYLRGDL